MSSTKFMNVIITVFASFGIIDLFTHLNDAHATELLQFIRLFIFDFNISLKVGDNKDMTAYYDNLLSYDESAFHIIEGIYLDQINLQALIFIVISLILTLNFFLETKYDIVKYPKIKGFIFYLKNYKNGYILSGLFTYFFNRLYLYRHLPNCPSCIYYGILDIVIFSLVMSRFGERTVRRAVLFWKDEFLYFSASGSVSKNRFIAIMPFAMFIRNVLTIFILIYLKWAKLIAIILINILLVLYTVLVFLAFKTGRKREVFFKFLLEVIMVCLFNTIAFYQTGSVTYRLILLLCLIFITMILLFIWFIELNLRRVLWQYYQKLFF